MLLCYIFGHKEDRRILRLNEDDYGVHIFVCLRCGKGRE